MVCGIFGVASTQGTAAAHNSSWALARERNKRAREFFYFYIIIFRFIKNIYLFFFQICHHAAGLSGGNKISPNEPAVGDVGHGLTSYYRMKRR